MRPSFRLILSVAFGLIISVAAPALASTVRNDLPELQLDQPPAPEWLANSCTVEIQCEEGGKVSCSSSNNNCATESDCVVCNGIRQGCCADVQACLDQCAFEHFLCSSSCGCCIGSACNQRCVELRRQCDNACLD